MDKKIIGVLLGIVVLSACVATPPQRTTFRAPQPVNLAQVYFYPQRGQSPQQQDRDRYDCHVWAVKQTGFDPTQQAAPRDMRATAVPAQTPGQTVGAAAIVGAVLGAVIAGPHNVGKGAVVGAMAGTVAGSAAAANDQAEADAANDDAAQRPARAEGRYEREAADYRRAMSACLTGRGYSVR